MSWRQRPEGLDLGVQHANISSGEAVNIGGRLQYQRQHLYNKGKTEAFKFGIRGQRTGPDEVVNGLHWVGYVAVNMGAEA